MLSQHQQIFDFENRAKETTKIIGRIHGFFNTQLGRILVELPILLVVIHRPSILGSLSLAVVIGSTRQIQVTLEKIIFGYIKIQSNLQSLNRAKTFVEMEPEPGYGDQIKDGLKQFKSGSKKSLEAFKKWDLEESSKL